jgi:AhpD family alkylhydroperoxidase
MSSRLSSMILGCGGIHESRMRLYTDLRAILAVSEAAGCDYCVAAHTLWGKAAGLSLEAMNQVRAGAATGDAKRDALVRFVRALVTTSGTIDYAELNAVRDAGYSEQQVIEVCLTMASITFTNLVNRVNDTTLDIPAVV